MAHARELADRLIADMGKRLRFIFVTVAGGMETQALQREQVNALLVAIHASEGLDMDAAHRIQEHINAADWTQDQRTSMHSALVDAVLNSKSARKAERGRQKVCWLENYFTEDDHAAFADPDKSMLAGQTVMAKRMHRWGITCPCEKKKLQRVLAMIFIYFDTY